MNNERFILNTAEKRIKDCLKDYSNEFLAINITLSSSGIEGVRELLIGGYKIPTVEEYLEKSRKEKKETVSAQDEKNPMFVERIKIFNDLANEINTLGKNIDEETIKEIIGKVMKNAY